ncbi:MAG: SMC domain protein, partial [bacterium]
MYISKFRVHNYKCFLDSQELVFNPGINVIVGPNDVGKTALLEALSLNFPNRPHMNVLGKNGDKSSYAELTVSMNKSELGSIIRQTKSHIEIPFPAHIADTYRDGQHIETSPSQHFEEWLEREEEINIRMKLQNGQVEENKRLIFDLYNPPQSDKSRAFAVTVYWQESGRFSSIIGRRANRDLIIQSNTSKTQDLNKYILDIVRSQIHFTSATRFSKDKSTLAAKPILQQDGSNLAQVLGSMQSHINRNKFNLFNEIASYLFPAIKRVSVKTLDKNELEIQLWTITDNIELEDYALPISKCGTGYATTLPLVCFMVTPEQKCLLIDEPQAFLHPGAIRKLVDKINLYS